MKDAQGSTRYDQCTQLPSVTQKIWRRRQIINVFALVDLRYDYEFVPTFGDWSFLVECNL